MAVRAMRVGFIGLSTDTKPTSTGNLDFLKPGDPFIETDTWQQWIWDGSNWVEDMRMVLAMQQAIGGE